MNADTAFPANDGFNPMELRILAWVCGEASPTEAAELEQLTAAHPEWAQLRQQLQGTGELLAAAATQDPEPLRLSARRRRRLLRNLMPRKNLMISAAMAVSLIAGVAVYGERTHYVPPVVVHPPADKPFPIPMPPPDPDPVAQADTHPDEKPVVANPMQPDVPPVYIPTDAFTQPVEPPAVPGPDRSIAVASGPQVPAQPILNLDQLDTPPSARYQARADYPYSLRQQGVSGEVLVEFIVDPHGEVRNAAVVRSTDRGFEDSAVRAVSRWKFRPGRKGGVAVYVRMQVPVVFTLDAN